MKKNPQGWLLISDLDGSLLNSKKEISEENKDTIRAFMKKGGRFTIATGRTELTSRIATDVLRPDCPIALYNGSAVYDMEKQEFLWKNMLDFAVLRPMLAAIMERWTDICIQVFAGGPLMMVNPNGTVDMYVVGEQQPHIFCSLEEVQEKVLKIMFSAPNAVLKQIEAFIQVYSAERGLMEYEMFFSAAYYMEIVPLGCSKGECLKIICAAVGADLEKTIALGDHFNDIAMLRTAAVSLAPENAVPEAKAAATHLVGHHDRSPLAKFLTEFFAL